MFSNQKITHLLFFTTPLKKINTVNLPFYSPAMFHPSSTCNHVADSILFWTSNMHGHCHHEDAVRVHRKLQENLQLWRRDKFMKKPPIVDHLSSCIVLSLLTIRNQGIIIGSFIACNHVGGDPRDGNNHTHPFSFFFSISTSIYSPLPPRFPIRTFFDIGFGKWLF